MYSKEYFSSIRVQMPNFMQTFRDDQIENKYVTDDLVAYNVTLI